MKKTVALLILMAANISITKPCIKNFVHERDIEGVLEIIHDDWNWLFKSSHPDYDPEYLLKFEIPGEELLTEKKLEMKVLREKERVVGFITFYKENTDEGSIRLLSVAQDYRKNELNKKLITAAINNLFDSGCTSVYLFTYKNNEKVGTYKSLGFKEVEIPQETILQYEEAGISSDEYRQYMKCAVTKETFKPTKKLL